MKKSTAWIKWIAISLVSFGFACAFGFYLVVGCGALSKVQDFWVESAMTTFHHHWMAEWFVPAPTIEEHQQYLQAQREEDEDVETKTEIKQDQVSDKVDVDAEEEKKYTAEGYTRLSSGVYFKEVTGTASAGKYVGQLMLCTDPSRVKLVDTDRQYVCGARVSDMIVDNGAIAGINAGGFIDGANFDSNGGTPYGIIIEDNVLVCPRGADGGSYRMVGIRADNTMIMKTGSADWAVENGIRSAVTAEGFLIVDGVGRFAKGESGGWGCAPRTALGQRATGEIIFLTVDGRQVGYSIGCDLGDLMQILLDEQCVNAGMMDGGSSTVMEYATYDARGNATVELLNKPNLGHSIDDQRWINNAWVIMPREQTSVKDEVNHEGQVEK